ncbi:hypothetical protein [Variovorax sp. Varisp62]|uniref:hypothetical protein n=1 Tax=Variovorax sp. Varisp62 TaxID=3243049 RepID=UPI0039B571ED
MADTTTVKTDSLFDQTMASLVQLANTARDAAGAAKVDAQNLLFEQASIYIDTVREFIDKPGNILGSPATKHGEIAEVAEVGVRNAWDVLSGLTPSASSHPDRIGPVDIILGESDVQSKFYNGIRNTLGGVTEHLEKYPDFPEGTSHYLIPKDQYELLQKALRGEATELSPMSIERLKESVQNIEALTGREFDDAVRPASFGYKEVQLGRIDETLDERQDELSRANEKRVEDIQAEYAPSWQEGLKTTAIAAGVGAGVSFVRASFGKYREGKNIFKGEFTAEDWQDVGLDTAQGAAIGGATGGALYLMTNCASMSAPLAGAVVSAVKGLAPLVQGYRAGDLTLEQLVDTGCMVCAEVGMVAAATAIGQAVIPVPVLGALIGSIAGQVLSSILARQVQESTQAIAARVAGYTASLDLQQKQVMDALLTRFARLGELTVAAFDVGLNAGILEASATLARTYGIEASSVLRTTRDVDRFMLG